MTRIYDYFRMTNKWQHYLIFFNTINPETTGEKKGYNPSESVYGIKK
ncbi:MAG: hypothetical protein V9F01_01325 [Chitinophagaceae bacterium]